MNILGIGDPHGSLPKDLNEIVKKENIEMIICPGDIPAKPKNASDPMAWVNFKKKADKSYEDIVKKLCSYNLPVLILRGDMYIKGRGRNFTMNLFKKYKNLYCKKTAKLKINGQDFLFFDINHESHAPRFRSYSKKDEKLNNARSIKINKLLKRLHNPIVISHAPPYGFFDKIPTGKNIGSKILLNAIKRYPPKLVLCGHVHINKGVKKLGKTKIYNLGYKGEYQVIKT